MFFNKNLGGLPPELRGFAPTSSNLNLVDLRAIAVQIIRPPCQAVVTVRQNQIVFNGTRAELLNKTIKNNSTLKQWKERKEMSKKVYVLRLDEQLIKDYKKRVSNSKGVNLKPVQLIEFFMKEIIKTNDFLVINGIKIKL